MKSLYFFSLLLSAALAVPALAATPNLAQIKAVEDRFPDPARLLAAFPDQPQRTAALIIVRDEIYKDNGHWPNGKVKAYNDAFKQVQAEQTRAGIKLDWGGMTKPQRQLAYWYSGNPDAKPFRRMVFAKYLPGVADSEAALMGSESLDVQNIAKYALGLAILGMTLAFVLILPWLLVVWREEKVSVPGKIEIPAGDPLALPNDLREVRLPRLRYPVGWTYGMVFEIKTWTETNTKVTATSGPVTVHDSGYSSSVTVGPTEVTTETHTTRNDEVWLQTPDGRQVSRTFTGGYFKVANGQVISLLTTNGQSDGLLLLAYNHSTGQLKTFDLGSLHALPVFGKWVLATLAGVAGALLAVTSQFHFMPMAALSAMISFSGVVLVVLAMIAAGISVVIPSAVYPRRRNRAFQRVYLPAFKRLFERATPVLQSGFGVTAGGGPAGVLPA